jgi:8-oxo-dGTP diphosphatase
MNEIHPTKIVVAAVIERDGAFLIAQRRATDRFPGLWEFPGGKVDPGESPEEALRRECQEELAIEIEVNRIRDVIFHRYEAFSVLLLFYNCRIVRGEPQPIECSDPRWVPLNELDDYPLLPGDLPFVERLKQEAASPGFPLTRKRR